MSYAINLLSVVPMRKEATHRSEMVSQLLFGEYVEVLEDGGDFWRVKCLYDGYEGWVQASQLKPADEVKKTDVFVGHWSGKVSINDHVKPIPFSAPVFAVNEPVLISGVKLSYDLSPAAIWQSGLEHLNAATLLPAYSPYLDTPYLWGGKSVFGIDCSGFAQQVFKLFGIKLLRDAYQQATQGEAVSDLDASQAGDLAFFHNEAGRITHVGILLRPDQIVHAAGKVRIDVIDKDGIINVDTGKRTHQLHSIRRFI